MTVRRDSAQPGAESIVGRLFELGNRELDERFRASPAGDIPDGEFRGSVILFPGSRVVRLLAALAHLLLWQGKVFDRARGDLKNHVTPLRVKAVRALVSEGASWVDEGPCVVIDYSTTSWLARPVRDEIRRVEGAVYLGVVWLWRRRVAWFVLRPPNG